jgi:membrane-bound lytic murein transglycosylase D
LAVFFVGTPVHAVEADPFPRPDGLEADIAFWKSVFGDYSSAQALLHDNRYLGVVYEVVDIPPGISARQRGRLADKVRGRYRKILQTLGKGKRTNLSAEEQRVLDLWPDDVSNAELLAAAKRIRFQQGLSDRYLEGLKRSGRWRAYIEQQFSERKLPIGLAALPHVESSFNPEAHSHVGASGLWQFTRSTGRRFMEIDHVVDERRDPFRSSEAAAELLAYNYSILGSWPLAITAYNHGVAGMRRAVRKTGGEDFTVINQEYQGRTFGFASRNFYLAFLAALEVEQEAEKYFGNVQKELPRYDLLIKMPGYTPADSLAEALGVSKPTLRSYNPALLDPVWNGTKHVPKGYEVRIPASLVDATADEILESMPERQWFASQTPDMYHKVRRGESLSVIAARYDTSVTHLMQLNNIKSRHRIRAGQTLRLPYAGVSIPTGAETYTVRNGDSVSKIAQRAGVSEAELMSMNQIRNRNRIYVGQVLYLRPSPESKRAAARPVAVASTQEAAPAVAKPKPQVADEPVKKAPAEERTTEEVLAASADTQAPPTKTQASRADPNDYSVGSDNTIEVQAAETLGHYADWLQVRTQSLRDINGLSYRRPVVVGQRVKLDLSNVDVAEFTNRRVTFHRDMQEAFFASYRVIDTTEHKLKRGESVWVLTHQNYKVPVWLVRQYNPDLDFGQVRPGMRIVFPLVERVDHQARIRGALAEAS